MEVASIMDVRVVKYVKVVIVGYHGVIFRI